MQQSEMAFLSSFRWQNRKNLQIDPTNIGDMANQAKRPTSEGVGL